MITRRDPSSEQSVEWWKGAYQSKNNQEQRDRKHPGKWHLPLLPEPKQDVPGYDPRRNRQRGQTGNLTSWLLKLECIPNGWGTLNEDCQETKHPPANTCSQHSNRPPIRTPFPGFPSLFLS